MPLSYKFVTALLAFTGCASLAVTGELVPVFMVPGIALVLGYYRFLRGYEPAPRWLISSLSVAAVGLLAFDMAYVSGDFFVAVAHMTIVFQALKSFDLREPWDHLQVYFMALLQLIMTSELAISMAVGGMFVVFLFILVAAIILSHFMKEGTFGKVGLKRPVAVIALVVFVFTTVFFVAVPRARGGFWSRKTTQGIRSVGFSEEVDFGSFGEVLKDPSIVMRVSVSGPRLPLYWRGITLDYFDGTAWKDTLMRRHRLYKVGDKFEVRRPGRGDVEPTVQEVFLEPVDTEVIFGLGEITAMEAAGRWLLYADSAGSLYMPGKSNMRFIYKVYSVPSGGLDERERYAEHYLQLPDGAERVSALAREVAGTESSELQAARRIESYLKANYAYSLDTGAPPEGVTPIEDFLFNSRRGYCEHFATSMALMLRALGIPSRIVTGFAGGEENAMGDYVIVRQKDAHSWVEAAIGGKWMTFDPTPPEPEAAASAFGLFVDSVRMNWYRYVVGFSSQDQKSIIRSATSPVVSLPALPGFSISVRPVYIIIAFTLAVAIAARLLIRGLPARRSFETRAYLVLVRAVKKQGGKVRPSWTPEEVLREARRLGMDGRVSELVRLYEDVRFGGRRLDSDVRARLKELASEVRLGR